MNDKIPTYCTPEEVAETLDLPSETDNYGNFQFSDMSHPSYTQVCRMICSNEDIIDRRLKRSWKTNYVKDFVINIPKYWQDENAWRTEYYRQGGNSVQLRKDILPWDPTPIYSNDISVDYVSTLARYIVGEYAEINGVPGRVAYVADQPESSGEHAGKYLIRYYREHRGGLRTVYEASLTEDYVDTLDRYVVGEPAVINNTKGKVAAVKRTPETSGAYAGKYEIQYYKEVYGGDKLEVRTNSNIWLDMSNKCIDHTAAHTTDEYNYSDFDSIFAADVQNNTFWFDRTNGRLFIKRRVFMPASQSMRISYRYGTPDEEIPSAINRLACLLTASQVINMQAFNVRLGVGGDITGIKDQMLKGWQDEMNTIYASYQRPGSVYSLLR